MKSHPVARIPNHPVAPPVPCVTFLRQSGDTSKCVYKFFFFLSPFCAKSACPDHFSAPCLIPFHSVSGRSAGVCCVWLFPVSFRAAR